MASGNAPPCHNHINEHQLRDLAGAAVSGVEAVKTPIRRMRSSLSDSLVETESETDYDSVIGSSTVRGEGDSGREKRRLTGEFHKRRTMSLYGATPSGHFGPKACLAECQESILKIQDPGCQKFTWRKPPQSVLIIKKLWDEAVDQPFVQLAHWLVREQHLEVYVESKVIDDPMVIRQPAFAEIRDSLSTFKDGVDNLCGCIDFIICLGGDGTLLYASTLFQESVPPVMAFHLGSLGFLSPFEFSEFEEHVLKVLGGSSVPLMLRTRLNCVIERGADNRPKDKPLPERQSVLVLNEVVVDRGASPYLCQLDLYIQQQQVTVVQGDGLIISTPTGSTAYAAAAGASIVHPNVPAIVIAPICPHSLSFRPIVVPAGVEIKVMVSPDARGDAWASFDGRQRQCISKGDSLVISTSKYPLPSICHSDPVRDWFSSLAACLHWNVRKPQLPLVNNSRAPSETRDSNSEYRDSGSESNGSVR